MTPNKVIGIITIIFIVSIATGYFVSKNHPIRGAIIGFFIPLIILLAFALYVRSYYVHGAAFWNFNPKPGA